MRHGARSHYEDNVPNEFFDGVKKGYVTIKGKYDQIMVGLQRRQEYVVDKNFLSEQYKQQEILSLATFRQRCVTSGQYFLHGLYPFDSYKFSQEQRYYDQQHSVLAETSFRKILKSIERRFNVCFVGPVIEIPIEIDIMLHTRSCKTLHEYLYEEKYDKDLLQEMMLKEFGNELLQETQSELEEYFGTEINTLKQYFQLVDAKVAELYQMEHPNVDQLQRQECFIVANNFVGPEKIHGEIFVSRYLVPMAKVLDNVIQNYIHGIENTLKYLIVNFHDTNLSNMLRFLQYFDVYGYHKYVRYSSSIRFEILHEENSKFLEPPYTENQFKVRIVFDDEEIKLPFCQDVYCTYQEFKDYFITNLYFDHEFIENYCNGKLEDDFENELKFRTNTSSH